MSLPYGHVAACVDGSDAARGALMEARTLADAAGGRLSVVHVIPPPPFIATLAAGFGGGPVHDPDTEREAAAMWLAEEAARVGGEPVLLEGQPPSTACAWAREAGCDLIVAAGHSGALERAVLGSFASYLAHHAPCAVLLTRAGGEA